MGFSLASPSATTLYYIYDPMCSWCWGFDRAWKEIQHALPPEVHVEFVLGGLAADSSEVMPQALQGTIKSTWKKIQVTIPWVEFNYDFWEQATPRRSTYPSCRAVIAAKTQDKKYEVLMLEKIQRAYYLEARNPSDEEELIALAASLGLNVSIFKRDLCSQKTQNILENNIHMYHKLVSSTFIKGFPSLVIKHNDSIHAVPINYTDAQVSVEFINQFLFR